MRFVSLAISVGFVALALQAVPAAADPTGVWRVGDGSATVRISKCNGANLCGYVASTQTSGGRDEKNPDPAKRNRPVLGLEVLINLKGAGPNAWSGASYNAEDGQMYSVKMSMQGEQSLTLQGCAPGGGMCGSETWSRVR